MAVKANPLSFEKSLEKLESIVGRLESGDVPLADAVKLFEEGIALRKRCLDLLKDAEKKISFLSRSVAGDPAETDPPDDWEEDRDAG
jgi:exodeoxyribonuclease VII small subunit